MNEITDFSSASAAPPSPATPASAVDFGRIERNVQRMIEQGAPKEDVGAYLQGEGVSAEQLLSSAAPKTEPSFGETAMGAVRKAGEIIESGGQAARGTIISAAKSAAQAIKGQEDPAYAGLSGFTGEGIRDPDFFDKMKAGKMFAPEDSAYGDIIKKSLGSRLMSAEKDKFGQEVIRYRDDGGVERRAYINKPGFDFEDIDRFAAQSAPYLVGGGLASVPLRAIPFLGRLAVQAPIAGSTSIGADVLAGKLGSKEGVDLPRAGFAAGGAAVGEMLSPAAWALWRRVFVKPGMAKGGQLTEAGRAEAEALGLDPSLMEGKTAEQFAESLSIARDPNEVASAFKTGEFGIPTTKGQRTKDPQILQMEVEMRRGLWGEQAKQIMVDFDKSQSKAVGEAVTENIGGAIAPAAAGREKATLGKSIHDGVRAAKAWVDEVENDLWGRAGPMFPREEGFDLLAGRINASLQASHIRPSPNLGAFPMSNDMLGFLENYSKDKLAENALPLIGKGKSSIFLDDARRFLLNMYRSAEPGSADAKSAKAIYDGFNTWIDDLADNAMLVGKPDAAAALKTARAFTKDMKQLFAPTEITGVKTPAGRKLDVIFNKADSPETVLDAIVPEPATKLRPGDVDALKHMKEILVNRGQAPDVWDDLRLAYWVKIAQDNKGQIHSPKLLQNRINAAFENQRTAIDVMFDPAEQSLMKRFASALDEATWVDPNPSGSSYALESMRRRFSGGSALKTLLQTQSKRELFSKHNVLASRIYQILARKMPVSVFGSKEGFGAKGAERTISQEISPREPTSLAGPGAAVGVELSE